ncbi:AMP-dependent synthetase/ligase [Umezawaea sp. Da 62-37]|uniref:AMP-dependent synthetase/ligase n=1 Tax=Umezawaea sp. Da 62-37 TaxID=3075927 RepID=UPI0028F6E34E|nr:AMP-dependent synthetase/ligase [Umezawaea sp. Da 62-37]WNV89367.1 AMP-dependent synthetase/ligase [Umezawaea sp. Da 62-37]
MSVPTVGSARVVSDLPFVAAQVHQDRVAWRYREHGAWQQKTFTEVAEAVGELAAGFAHAGVRVGDRVAVLAETRYEWSIAGLAVLAAGGIVVPIYASSSPEECAYIIENSGAVLLVAENAAQAGKIDLAALPDLREVLVVDADSEHRTTADLAEEGRANPAGEELESRRAGLSPDDPSVIIYTSGTTGPPKGCVLTHRNWLAMCHLTEELSYVVADDTVYLFLPLAHVFAQITQFSALYMGATLAYFGGDAKRIVPELAEVKPTFLPSVPRIFEKIYTIATAGIPAEQLQQAVGVGLKHRALTAAGQPVPPELEAAFTQVDAVFARVRGVFGGRLRQALSGAAPISPEVLNFFLAAGVPVLEGYGMSESTGVGTTNTLGKFRIGSVGAFGVGGLDVRIAEDGEILMNGPHLFAGYWRNPEATAEVLQDGWLHTGDLGVIDEDGFVTITGRKKDIIITAGGKNIAPANVENQLRQSRWISHAVVFGDRRPYLVALITLDAEEIVPWAEQQGIAGTYAELVAHPTVVELVQGLVDDANAHFVKDSQIKRFSILDRDLSQEDGELTPTLKVKRKVIHSVHEDLYQGLYT